MAKIRGPVEIDTVIGLGQWTLGDLSYEIVKMEEAGQENTKDHTDKVTRLIMLFGYLDFIIDDDGEIQPQFLEDSNAEKFNKLLDGIYKLSNIFNVSAAPILGMGRAPLVYAGIGQAGTPGTTGPPGSDADIDVIEDPDYDNMSVIEVIISGVKTYKLGYAPYVAPTDSIAIQGSHTIEIGTVIATLGIIVTSTKGRETIIRRQIVSPGGLTLSNPNLNDPGPQQENIAATNVAATTTYVLEVEDDRNTVSANDTITFVYPFFYGATPSTVFTVYTALTKLIESKSNKSVLFNGVNKYFSFAYPVSYGLLTQILDQNQFPFNIATDWVRTTVNVTSVGLTNNYVNIPYYVYTTASQTTINNGTYTFKF